MPLTETFHASVTRDAARLACCPPGPPEVAKTSVNSDPFMVSPSETVRSSISDQILGCEGLTENITLDELTSEDA